MYSLLHPLLVFFLVELAASKKGSKGPEYVQVPGSAGCWATCGNRGGACDNVCGPGGHCCRKGYRDCDKKIAAVALNHRHSCVRPTSPVKPASTIGQKWRQIPGSRFKSCWLHCGHTGGKCPKICGKDGWCCHRKFKDCPKPQAAVALTYRHSCVRPVEPVKPVEKVGKGKKWIVPKKKGRRPPPPPRRRPPQPKRRPPQPRRRPPQPRRRPPQPPPPPPPTTCKVAGKVYQSGERYIDPNFCARCSCMGGCLPLCGLRSIMCPKGQEEVNVKEAVPGAPAKCTCNVPKCVDVNECKDKNGGCSQQCVNTKGSFECKCNKGFELEKDGRTCSDNDECARDNGGCNQVCNNNKGSFKCSCNKKGFSLGKDGKTCEDVDECNRLNGGCLGECINSPGSFSCSCAKGYLLMDDDVTCEDMNECYDKNGGCGKKKCVNLPGSHTCACGDGYMEDENGQCIDINECWDGNGGCQHKCVNRVGSVSCACNNGYTLNLDKRTCNKVVVVQVKRVAALAPARAPVRCRDRHSSCNNYAGRNKCNLRKNNWKSWMHKKCRKACKLC